MTAEESKHGVFWWLSATLMPLGILSGPVGIASMLEGFIEWHGPFGLAINYWEVFVSQPFGVVFGQITSFFTLPPLSKFWVDYFSLGILLRLSVLRSFRLAVNPAVSEIDYVGKVNWFERILGLWKEPLLIGLWWVWALLLVFRWALGFDIRSYQRAIDVSEQISEIYRDSGVDIGDMRHYHETMIDTYRRSRLIILLPFGLFLVLWGLNSLLS